MKIVICGKCAANMDEKKATGGSRKDTCQICGKRRYCTPYDMKVKK